MATKNMRRDRLERKAALERDWEWREEAECRLSGTVSRWLEHVHCPTTAG